MSKLVERYPQAQRLPLAGTPADDAVLLNQIEPYLGWVLAEIDTGTTDILICDSDNHVDGKPQHLVLLTGRAVSLWLKYHQPNPGDNSAIADHTPDE